VKTLAIVGGNLFQLAAQELGDATQWIRIAQQNDILDPVISGPISLQIPDPIAYGGGGVASQ
jgi:hypothetical protein